LTCSWGGFIVNLAGTATLKLEDAALGENHTFVRQHYRVANDRRSNGNFLYRQKQSVFGVSIEGLLK